MLFSVVRYPSISASELNHDLQLINNWTYQWKLSFNPQPKQAVEVLFPKKNKTPVDEHKHLWLTLDPKFTKHIISKSKVARKNIDILKHLYPYLPLTTLDQLYKIYIRSHLHYCDIIFHVPHLRNCFDPSFYIKYNYGNA